MQRALERPDRAGDRRMDVGYDVHPNLIANWKKQARQTVLAGFSGNHERQEASRETAIKELRAKIGELVIRAGFFVQGLRSLSHGRRVAVVDPHHARLSLVRQCRLVSIARSSFYYAGKGESPLNLRLMRLIDEQFLATPFYGSRQMTRWLRRQGDTVSRKRVRRLMRLLGAHAVFQRPRLPLRCPIRLRRPARAPGRSSQTACFPYRRSRSRSHGTSASCPSGDWSPCSGSRRLCCSFSGSASTPLHSTGHASRIAALGH